jgi:hypothetical protein
MLIGETVVTAYAVYVVPGVSGGVLCHGRLCCRGSVGRGGGYVWLRFYFLKNWY